jgi:drug/metabolite transporter (DMT)-like permease
MTHRGAVLAMVLVTLLWSIAGVVTRHLEVARGFEVTFWRSAFNAGALVVWLGLARGADGRRAGPLRTLRAGGATLFLSGVAWSFMFTAFMLALTRTTVANVLVTMAVAPLASALLARFVLDQPVPARTVAAGLVAGLGIGWMHVGALAHSGAEHLSGSLIALCVPLAAAANWTLLAHSARGGRTVDMRPAVLIGALLSAAATLGAALPFQASTHDLSWLALLGVVQLALPCSLAVAAARTLSAPEVALLSLLEVVFGVAWAWLGAGERPPGDVLVGGALVLGALAANELLAARARGAATT